LVSDEDIVIPVLDQDPRAAQPRPMRLFQPSGVELARHAAFVAKLKNPLWGADASG
jgi:DNA polymerase-3 subunit epsilon